MKRILINDYGVFLGRKRGRILIRKEGEKVAEVAAGDFSQIIIASKGVTISSALLRLLLKHKIDLVILSGSGSPMGRLISRKMRGGIKIRKSQYAAQMDLRGTYLAKQFVKGKLTNQKNLLRSLAKNRRKDNPKLAREVMLLSDKVTSCLAGIESIGGNLNESREKLMFYEAKAAEKYWKGIGLILKGTVDFPGRKKKYDFPTDPVNILLNYGYGILYSEVWMNLEFTSLDPYAGFLHVDSPRRPALVMDLVEEFRQPVVDRAVLKLISKLKSEVKNLVDKGMLSKDGRKQLIQLITDRLRRKVTFQKRCLPIETHILLQTRRLTEFIMGRSRVYTPFFLR